MPRVCAVQRPMSTPEKYYALLHQTWPMNPILVADLDHWFEPDLVERRWYDFCVRRILTRLVGTADLCVRDAGLRQVDVSTRQLRVGQWDQELGRESTIDYGLDTPLHCRYLHDPEVGRSRIYLVGNHSIVDGKRGVQELQLFLRSLDGQEVGYQREISAPAPPRSLHPWQQDRRALVDRLRTLAEYNRKLGEPGPAWWPPVGVEREPRFGFLDLDPDTMSGLLAAARSHGVGASAALSVAWLISAARLSGEVQPVLQLGTAIDLATPSDDENRAAEAAIGVLVQRHRVDGDDPWELARQIRAQMAESARRGDGELFFHLTRVQNIDDLLSGTDIVARQIADAPPMVGVTNLGVLDPGSDPAWVHCLYACLAPAPNQVVYAAGLGYRGQLCNSIVTDDLRVSPAQRSSLVSGFDEALAAMLAAVSPG